MPPETRATQTEAVINFMKSPEFAIIIKQIVQNEVQNETNELKREISELKNEVVMLRESNIEMVHLLTNNAKSPLINNNKDLNNKPKFITTHNKKLENDNGRKTTEREKTNNMKKNETDKDETVQIQNECSPNLSNKGVHTLDEGKWEYPKRRRKNFTRTIYGKGADDSTFKGVAKYIDYHIYRLPPNFVEKDVLQHLSSKNISEVTCEKMNSRYPNQYSSFKVSVSIKNDREFRNPKIWPEYVVINRFLPKILEKMKRS